MGDFYMDTRQAQRDLAAKFAAEIVSAIPAEVKSVIQKEGLGLMRQRVQEIALKFIQGYTGWLVDYFLQSGNFEKQKLPILETRTWRRICRRHDLDFGFVSSFLKRLAQPEVVIPAVGRIYADGEIIPNRAGLEEWFNFLKKNSLPCS